MRDNEGEICREAGNRKRNDINYWTTQLLERDSERFLCRDGSGGSPPGRLTDPVAVISVTSDAADLEWSLDLFRCISADRVSSKDLGLARLMMLSPLRILDVLAVVLVLFTDWGRSF